MIFQKNHKTTSFCKKHHSLYILTWRSVKQLQWLIAELIRKTSFFCHPVRHNEGQTFFEIAFRSLNLKKYFVNSWRSENLESNWWCSQVFKKNEQKITNLSIFSLGNTQDSDLFCSLFEKIEVTIICFRNFLALQVNFIYSEKATKFCEIFTFSTFDWHYIREK